MERLKDKVAVITGGAGGIGLATAETFLQEGAKVMLVDLNEHELKERAAALKNDNVIYFAGDVSHAADVKKYTEACINYFGKIDIFFNNAGIEGVFSPISEYPEEVFDRVIAVNLKGVWLGCKIVIPKMTDGSSVILTSSVAGLKGFINLSPYVASKHAVTGVMRTIALEFAERRIRVNSIHPGPVNNRMMRSIEKQISPNDPDEAEKSFESIIPFKRYAENKEIANLALFLASDESAYLTGTTQVIDGGMSIV
ncbi:SDR family NAD(P)-dependent oxidoreductase [Salinimicrobium gaetbulicola]|uniref:SDR family NAD(P)-dependent oxidoreductase n=1 Tax=Salinimicrobium gaetbulicola TaxID=999702 RepID=A0ABW3IFV8_9FLAO